MGKIYTLYLDEVAENNEAVYTCSSCHTHLTHHDALISKAFQGHNGRAWLFKQVVNIREGPVEERVMTTGLHTVRDIFCVCCNAVVGWKYERAYEQSQRYKEGKFILERVLLSEMQAGSGY